MNKDPKISIVLPVYNEGENIAKRFRRLKNRSN